MDIPQPLEWTVVGIGGVLVLAALVVSNSMFATPQTTPRRKGSPMLTNPNELTRVKTPLGGRKSKKNKLH
jgi:hypothetical protein